MELGNKNKRFKSSENFKAPSAEELYQLKSTETLYNSNLFRLQINELIAEIAVADTELVKYEKTCEELIKTLKNMKPIVDTKFNDLKKFEQKNLVVPLGELSKKMEGVYSFKAPTNVHKIGSYASHTMVNKTNLSVDLAVEMPAELFNERDYLNYKYFIKRSLYASHVCLQLLNHKKYSDVKIEYLADHSAKYKPLLTLYFKDVNLEIHLHFVPSDECFKYHRFNPSMNNVRKEWFARNVLGEHTENENKMETDAEDSNPFYNFQMLADVSCAQNNRFLNETLPLNSKSIIEAIQLVKLWLLKRNLSQGIGSFDSFLLNNFMAYLILNKQINSHMSQYQIFRIALFTLSEANWHTNGLNLNDFVEDKLDDETKSKHNVETGNFHKHYQVVFVDSTGYLNIAAQMSKNTFLMAKHEASVSLRQLNDDLYDCFENLFIVEHQMEYRFDSLISLNGNCSSFYNDLVKKVNKQDELVDYLNEAYCVAVRNVEDLLNRALEQRTSLIFTKLLEPKRWSIYTKPQNEQEPALFGILFNDKYESILIKGPMSNTAEGAEFRKFWGAKSELRRFQDTSICEAVVFEASNVASKRLIYSEIVKYILKYHLAIDETNIKFCDRQLNSILSVPRGVAENYGTGEEKLADSIKMFDEFSRIIKDLNDLPLSIVNLQGVSPSFRYTETFPPLPCGFKYDKDTANNIQAKMGRKLVPKYPPGPVLAPYVPHLDVLLMLESSGKWPNDLDCIRRLKTAFYLKITEILKTNHNIMSFTNVDYLDVLYKGYVFRLSIFTMHELICMKSAPNEQGIIMTVETIESVNYERNMIYLPKITNALHALQQKYSCYSGICRLAKRWLSANFLLEYFEEEAIDLICSYLFVSPVIQDPPKSILFGFMKFLDLIANFDWKNQLLLLNFNNDLKKDTILDIKLKFQENRASLPPVFLITPYDNEKPSICTINKPNMQQLCRTVIMAKQSLNKLKTCIKNFESTENFKNIFRTKEELYDLVIDLKPEFCVKGYQKLDICEGTFIPHYRDWDPEVNKLYPIVDFDPVNFYIRDLREAFGDIALFFYDIYGGSKIYVLWKPDALIAKDLKITNVKSRMTNKKNKLDLNIEAVLDDIKIIGKDLIDHINFRKFKIESINMK